MYYSHVSRILLRGVTLASDLDKLVLDHSVLEHTSVKVH